MKVMTAALAKRADGALIVRVDENGSIRDPHPFEDVNENFDSNGL